MGKRIENGSSRKYKGILSEYYTEFISTIAIIGKRMRVKERKELKGKKGKV